MKNQFGTQRLAVLLVVTFMVATLLPNAAWAQTSATDPGIIMKGLQEEKRMPSRLEETVPVPKEETDAKGLSAEKIFVLKAVVLDGTTAYQGVDLSSVYGDMIGQKVSFADLNKIAQRMTRKYREDGYIFSRAVLPPQKVDGGIVHLRAVEGRIANVKVVGNFVDKNGLVADFASKIKTSGAANTKEIERYLLLIDDLPGLTAKSFIKPSATAGGGDLIIDVQEDPFEGSVSVDDRGSRTIGPYRGTLVGAFNSTFGIHDRTTLRGIVTSQISELRFGDITHEEQIGSEGFKVKGRAAFTSTEPQQSVTGLDIDGSSRLFDLEGTYPLLRGRQYNVNLIGGLNVLNSSTDVANIQVAEDHVRSLRVGGHFDFTDSLKGVNQIDVTATHGFDMLGATSDANGVAGLRSRLFGEHEFLRGNATATRIQELPDLFSLMLSATGQKTSDIMLASEQFTVGGPSFGRAYDSGEIAGDTGWGGVAELRYGGPVQNEFLQSYQLYTYIDYGKTHLRRPQVGEMSEDSVTSAGIGTRFNLIHDYSGYLELDKPMTKLVASENDRSSRLFFSVLKRF